MFVYVHVFTCTLLHEFVQCNSGYDLPSSYDLIKCINNVVAIFGFQVAKGHE